MSQWYFDAWIYVRFRFPETGRRSNLVMWEELVESILKATWTPAQPSSFISITLLMNDGLAEAPLNHHCRSLEVLRLPRRRQMVEEISQIIAWIILSSHQKPSFWSSWISRLPLMSGHLVWSCIVSFLVKSQKVFMPSIESGTKNAMARMLKWPRCHSHLLHNLTSCMILSLSISRIPSTGMMKNGTQAEYLTFKDPLRRRKAALILKLHQVPQGHYL